MLTFIRVSGFKSLQAFSLELRPGLNVLIGPNGSGKSNIIDFLAFVGTLATRNVQLAVSGAGGAGALFRKVGATAYDRTISAHLFGSVPIPRPSVSQGPVTEEGADLQQPTPKSLFYLYDFELKLTKDREAVYFGSQRFRATATNSAGTRRPSQIKEWALIIKAAQTDDQAHDAPMIEKLDRRNLRGLIRESATTGTIARDIEYLFGKDESIVTIASRVLEPGYQINLDFTGGMIYNPQPTKIRVPEDGAKAPGIRSDGSGLYATLFAMTRPGSPRALHQARRTLAAVTFRPRIALAQLEEYFRLANPAMKAFRIINDTFDNQVKIRVTLEGARKTQLPLAALSDGTLKWMALITAVTTGPRIYAIEEPENYIHPRLQREAIRIIRDSAPANTFVLMSTHSETILNEATPEELVLVQWIKGRTRARRIRNQKRMRDEINKTGFGLGFFYIAGALEDA